MPFLSSLDRDEEVPVTSTPIFEGHLSIRTEKKQWQWRLFRFDGSYFTCLSTRKIKLPPNHSTSVKSTESNYSFTSPMLATPKDKNKRLVESASKTELKYYQLPEWTIDVANISAISILKRVKKNGLQQSNSKCFSIRTFDQNYYILKAQKQKDLERWLFVLTKMWKFTQAVKNQVLQQLQQQQQLYYPALPNPTAAAAAAHQVAQVQVQAQQVQQQHQQQAVVQAAVDDNIPLVHSIQQFAKPPALSGEKIRVIEEWRKSLAELMASDPCIKVSSPPPIEAIPDDDTMSVFTDMTSVSNRPKSIKRRGNSKRSTTSRSLRRNRTNSVAPVAAASDQHQELPLEGRSGPTLRKKRSDDVRNWMNNSSNNNKQPLTTSRAASISSRRKPMIQKLSTADSYQQVPLNNFYYSNSNSNNQHHYAPHSQSNSSTSPEIIQHMNFFQDVVTVCDDETCSYEHHQHQHIIKLDNNVLTYHTSVRGKKLIQVNQGEDSMLAAVGGRSGCKDEGDDPCIENVQLKIDERQQHQQHQQIQVEQDQKDVGGELGLFPGPNQDNINIVKRPTIITRRASMPLTDDNILMQQQYQQQYQKYQQQQQYLFDQQKMNTLSPLQFLSLTATKKELEKYKNNATDDDEDEGEEDMSLADLQRSLRQVGLQQQHQQQQQQPHTRSPSASSIQDLQKRSSRYVNNPSIVAPAIPPHQYMQQQQQQHHQQQHHINLYHQQQMNLFDYDQQKQLKQQQHQIQQHYLQQQQNLKIFLPSTSSSQHHNHHIHHYNNNI